MISLEGRRPKHIQLTQYQEINLLEKPLANEKVQRFLKLGTCCEKKLAVTRVCCFYAVSIFRGQETMLYLIAQ